MTEQKPKQTRKPRASKPKSDLVKMVRGEKQADVHPDMVESYKAGGWKNG